MLRNLIELGLLTTTFAVLGCREAVIEEPPHWGAEPTDLPGWYLGHTFGVYDQLTLTSSGNCRLEVVGAHFDWRTRLYGMWRLDPPWIALDLKQNEYQPISIPETVRLLPSQWGTSRCLVAEQDVIEFCNSINRDQSPYYKSFLRKGDAEPEQGVAPRVPEPIARLILPHPIEGSVVDVGGHVEVLGRGLPCWDLFLTVDLGREDGVFNGMKLELKAKEASGTITVRDLLSSHCVAVRRDISEPDPKPLVGSRVVSSMKPPR